jgi:hypothetical protein
MLGGFLWLAAGLLALLPATSALAANPMDAYESMAQPDFMRPRARTPTMREMAPRLDTLRQQLRERQRSGDDLVCARQIQLEAHWLMNYTNRERDLRHRIKDLKAQIARPDRELPSQRDPEDDGFGRCHKEWFLGVDDSFQRLSDSIERGTARLSSMKLLERISTPERLTAYFDGLLVSDVAREGVDRRKELNVMVTALSQFLFLPKFQSYAGEAYAAGRLHPGLAAALKRFMDEHWQDIETGYWGAMYREQGQLVRTADLSITFHIVSYRDGQVPFWDRIVNTTFDIRERPYPYGWEDQGRQNTHHSYDVVRLLRLGWPTMNEHQQARAAAEISIMLARVLRTSLRGDGSFDDRPFDSVAHAYYFGVSFLDEVGYFRPSRRFWTDFPVQDGETVRARIERRMQSLDLDDPMLRAAQRKIVLRD